MAHAGAGGLAAVALLVSVAGANAKPIAATAEVNLRDTPTTSGKVLALIPKGTSVEVATCTNGWCQMSFNGQQGYAISRNLGIPQSVPPTRRIVRHGVPQVYAGAPPPYDPGPVYVGPGPYPYPYYGYYRPYYGPYFGPRWGWRRGWGFRIGW